MGLLLVPTKQDEIFENFRCRDHGLEDVYRKATEVVGRAARRFTEDGRIVGV